MQNYVKLRNKIADIIRKYHGDTVSLECVNRLILLFKSHENEFKGGSQPGLFSWTAGKDSF